MSSCQDALINNIYTNLQNFDSTIIFSLEKRRLKKLWLVVVNRRAIDLQTATDVINRKYDSGFYVKKSYPGISQEAINNLLSRYKVSDLNSFYSKLIVDPGTRTIQSCRGGFPTCLSANEVEKLCCNCFHAQLGKEEGCFTGGQGCQGGPSDCNARSNSNLFQTYIDKEIADAIATIDRNIATLRSQYELYTQRNLLVQNDVGCCQNIEFRNISASNIYFDTITNTCDPPVKK